MNNLEIVHQIYAAFGRGDVPAILDHLAPTVDWEYGATPNQAAWLKRRAGRQGAAEFFSALGQIQIERFLPKVFLAEGPVVVVLVDIEFTVKSTGKKVIEEDEVHLWHFDSEGKVVRFRHRVDTHQHHLAASP